MLAGLPKAPSRFNPVVNPQARQGRGSCTCCGACASWASSTTPQFDAAQKTGSLVVRRDRRRLRGPRRVRRRDGRGRSLYERYQDDAYTQGLPRLHHDVEARPGSGLRAVRRGVLDYDRRHGYRGAEAYVDLPAGRVARSALEDALQDSADSRRPAPGRRAGRNAEAGQGLPPRRRDRRRSPAMGLKFARAHARRQGAAQPPHPPRRADPRPEGRQGRLADHAAARGRGGVRRARPADGAIRALVGGFDFNRNKFNHVTQAWRQPGSSFKPFIYSAALEKGFTPATDHQRRAGGRRRRADRRPGLGAEELRRQVRRPDAHAHGARQVEEHGVDPHPAGDRPAVRAGLRHAASASTPTSTRPTSPWRWARAR